MKFDRIHARAVELAIDLEDVIGLTPHELKVFLAYLAISFGIAIIAWSVHALKERRSPAGRQLQRHRHFGGV